MQDGSDVREFMRRETMSESDLARFAGVSQSTVSRAIAGTGVRHGAARSKLFRFIHNRNASLPPKKGVQRVLTAFERIWDRTEEHADAVARIISALDNLRPITTKRK
jgi:predicted transcriptional regulator